jgi:hypothetical protein
MEDLVPNQADARNAAPSFSRGMNAFQAQTFVRSSLEPKRRSNFENVNEGGASLSRKSETGGAPVFLD